VLNFLLLGCGRISQNHIKALAANNENAVLAAVCDPILEFAEIAAERYNEISGKKPEVFTDCNQALAMQSIDCVVIARESGRHAEMALLALEHGCHVLVEKPIALSTSEAREVCDIARTKGLTVGVCNQNRFSPAVQHLWRAIGLGRFGRITHATARILWNRNEEYYKQAPWRGTWEMDGGVLMNQCIHSIDLLQWMLGGDAKSITAMTRRVMRPIEAEDFGAALVRFGSGAIGIIEGTACVYPKNLEETLSVFGEKGTAVIGGSALNLIKTWQFEDSQPQDHEVKELFGDNPVDVQKSRHTPLYADFINAVQTGSQPLINGEEGMKSLQLVLGAYKSQKEGQSIEMDELNFSVTQMQGVLLP